MLKDNWLNSVASGTYKFTFYVVSTDVYNQAVRGTFNESAVTNGQAVIIAEDGVEGAYAVQNVMITTITGTLKTGHAIPTAMTFDLLEPLGFGLIDRLLTVGDQLGEAGNIGNLKFVMTLEFIGRDGRTGASKKFPNTFLYPLKINGVTGSLGEAGAKYFFDMATATGSALPDLVTATDVTVENVTTVKTFGEQLEIALNDNAKQIQASGHPSNVNGTPIRYKVNFTSTVNIQALDFLGLESFDLTSAPWAGTTDSSTSGGQSESLEELGTRGITLNNHTQLCAKIRDLIAANVPTYAKYNSQAIEKGVAYEVFVQPTQQLVAVVDKELNTQHKIITLNIGMRRHDDIIPPNGQTIEQMQNSASIQAERFKESILPNLVKKYTYQYSGENTEVFDIDLQLHSTFYNALAPMAAIYHADNNNMFEANLEAAEMTNLTPNNDANPVSTAPGASVTYLSELPIQKYNLRQSPVFKVQPVGPTEQQVNETTTVDKIANLALINHASRQIDTQNLKIEVRGDPIFLGNGQEDIFSSSAQAIYMAFINYQPNPEDLLVRQKRGPIDMITTGIYKITEVSSKFQQGQFTQTIQTYREQNSSTFLLLDTLINLEIEPWA
jgi:hypothetical protein